MAVNPVSVLQQDPNNPVIDPGNLQNVNAAGNVAVASSAPPYNPLTSGTSNDPYNGQPNSVSNIATESQFNNAYSPQFLPGTQQTYNPIQNSPDQELDRNAYQLNPDGTTAQQTNANASQVNAPTNPGAANYDATLGTAAQGKVDPNSMIQNQFEQLMNDGTKDGQGVPAWARTAVTAANQRMNGLGLGASTMAGGATAAAILNAALPMAAANAQVVAQLNSQNLSNSQQTMLSNTAFTNAAAQFNAQNLQQNNQFFASLTSQIAAQNADRSTAVSQFNAGQANTLAQFNSNLANQREEFNTQNQLLIDQSNVQWRRTINTANTAGINAANQANAQTLFNLSQTDQNNLWQQSRDEASWALTSSENSQNRLLSLVNSSLNRNTSLNILSSTLNANMFSNLGALGVNLLNGQVGAGLASAVGLTGSSGYNGNVTTDSGNYGGSG